MNPQEDIEGLSDEILKKIDYSYGEVSIKEICDWLSKENGLRLKTEIVASGSKLEEVILGKISFNPLEIVVVTIQPTIEERFLSQNRSNGALR